MRRKVAIGVVLLVAAVAAVASVEPPWGGYADLVATYDVDFVEWPGMVLLRRAETPAIVIDKPVAPGTTAGNLNLVLGDYKIDIPLAVSASLYPPGRVWRLTRIG